MSEGIDQGSTRGPAPSTAGGLLRQARQAQGLHIAALAAAIKVTPRKLESLESDRFNELPDATFTRGLAQAVCRALKIDPAPVLALLPPPNGHRLEQVAEGLNTPFRERPGRLVPKEWASVSTFLMGAALLVLIATAVVYLWPAGFSPLSRWTAASSASQPSTVVASASDVSTAAVFPGGEPASAAGGSATDGATTDPASAAAAMPPAAATSDTGAPAAPAPVDAASAAAPPAAKALQFRVTADSWVDVADARGLSLMSRTIKPGESVELEATPPLKIRIGNARATQLVFRGKPVELASYTRDNIARFELK